MAGVCCECGRVRVVEGGQWIEIEAGTSLEKNTLCPECRAVLYPGLKRRAA